MSENNERDTQFFEDARILVSLLERQGFDVSAYGVRPYTLISHFLYDLAEHIVTECIMHMEHIDLDRLTTDEHVAKLMPLIERTIAEAG